MKRILVTGASGFIGSHTVGAFLEKGYHVVAQYRRKTPPERLKKYEGPNCALRQADLSVRAAAEELVRDIDIIVHIAGLTSDWGPYDDFYKANVLPSMFLCEAARKNKVKVLTYISSTVVHGFGKHIDSDESGPYFPYINNYQKTKKEAEDYVLKTSSNSLRTCALRPGNVYGPDDTTFMYPYFDQIMKGFLPMVSGGKSLTCPVYISDMVNAIVLATENPASAGHVYNITSGEKVTWKEIMDYACIYLGKKPLRISTPYRLGRFIAFIASGFARIFGINSKFIPTRHKIDQGGLDYHFTIKKALQELSYKPEYMICEGMKKTAEAYLTLKRKKS